ncbi:MAG: hypothetical protein QOJ25_1965 [Solirubrobacteraceae bacterium]|nr:hypothetical protein [Solirubrobacteraceae bacterium]
MQAALVRRSRSRSRSRHRHRRRLCVLLACALAPAGVLAGCGASSPAKPATTKTASAAAPTVTLSLAARLRQAIAACRRQVAAYPYIPASQLASAKAACNGFKTGNIGPLRAILRPACEQEVRTKVPAARQRAALAACEKVF